MKEKLTKNERKLCEILEKGFIAKDHNGEVHYFEKVPDLEKGIWFPVTSDSRTSWLGFLKDCEFKFMGDKGDKYDSCLYSVEHLLTLEYES